MKTSEFGENLLSGDLGRCISAAAEATLAGDEAIDVAASLLADRTRPRETRFWALQSLGQFVKRLPARVAPSAIQALSDPDPGIQAVALQVLEQLRPLDAVRLALPADW